MKFYQYLGILSFLLLSYFFFSQKTSKENILCLKNQQMREKSFCSTLKYKKIDKGASSIREYGFSNEFKLRIGNSWFQDLYELVEEGDSLCKEENTLYMSIIKKDTVYNYNLNYGCR